MLPFRRILFPVDYSEPCRAIVPYVRDAVRHFSAELALVHAYALAPSFATSGSGQCLVYNELTGAPLSPEATRALIESRLRDFAAEHFPGQHVECVNEEGEPGAVIHRMVQRHGTDLVMMPTHGYGPLRRLLLGSVAAKVLHDVSAAVWTGTGTALAGHEPQIPYRSIVCAVNRGEEAEAILKAAAMLACSYRAELFIVNAVDIGSSAGEYDVSEYMERVTNRAALWLREITGQLGIDATHSVREAAAPEAVREEALRRKADLVITGRGHSQASVGALWSHLYAIVRESPCPVLSV